MLDWLKKGAGDSSRGGPTATLSFELSDTREAPHISHSNKDGWFMKVHLGHDNELSLVLDAVEDLDSALET